MSRGYDFTLVAVIYLIAITVHRVSISLFGPESGLHGLASTGTSRFSGAERIDLWFEILTVWMPLMVCAGITAWAVMREYRRQAVTARTPGP